MVSLGPAGSATDEKPPGLVVVSFALNVKDVPLSSLSPFGFDAIGVDKAIVGTNKYINCLAFTIKCLFNDPLGSSIFKLYSRIA